MMANRATLKNFFIFSSTADAWHPMRYVCSSGNPGGFLKFRGLLRFASCAAPDGSAVGSRLDDCRKRLDKRSEADQLRATYQITRPINARSPLPSA
jgi:hypothetical protein